MKITILAKNTITEMKNTLERISRLENAEKKISNLEDKVVEMIQAQQQKRKKKLMRILRESSEITSRVLIFVFWGSRRRRGRDRDRKYT